MDFFESIKTYGDSILYVTLAFIWTIVVFSIYNNKKWLSKNYGYSKIGIFKSFIWKTISILPLVIMAGIRGYYTGADTHGVWGEFLNCGRMTFREVLLYDITAELYSIYSWIVAQITNSNAQIFMASIAFITLYLILSGIEKWNIKYGGLAIFIFLSCLGLNVFNQSRQMLSVAVLFYGYFYAYENYNKKYFITIVIASLIHFVSLPPGLAIWFLNKKERGMKQSIKFWSIYIASIVLVRYFLNSIIAVLPIQKYRQYSTISELNSIGMGLVLVCLPTVIMTLILHEYMRGDDKKIRNTILMTLPARLAGYTVYYVYRIYYYFSIQNVIAFPRELEKMSINNRRFYRLLIVSFCLTWFILFYGWLNADTYFPYQTYIDCGFYGIPSRTK